MALEKDHQRARAAHTLVDAVAGLRFPQGEKASKKLFVGPVEIAEAQDGKEADTLKRFNAQIHGLPVLIHRSGLLQAMAFFRAKAKARMLVYFVLLNWLRQCHGRTGMAELAGNDFSQCEAFFEDLIGQPSEQIRVLTREAQAFLVWLKQFSEARFGAAEQE